MSYETSTDYLQPSHLAALQRLSDIEFVASRPETFRVANSVLQEATELINQGYDVGLVSVEDPHRLGITDQARVDAEITRLEQSDNGHEEFKDIGLRPAMGSWVPLTKRAIALHALYNARTAEKLGEGIAVDSYDKPIISGVDDKGEKFDNKSASDLVRASKSPERAKKILDSYYDFVTTSIDDDLGAYVTSRDFYRGSIDARAVRTRAYCFEDMISDHVDNSSSLKARQDLVSVSLACGAGGPVCEMVEKVKAMGADFASVKFIDKDEMALASASAIAENNGLSSEQTQILRHDLLMEEMTDYIDPKSVDILDLLGIFEYIPNEGKFVNPANGLGLAADLLRRAGELVRPGGVMVFGNMLKDRPQQGFFKDVVRWPRLQQRNIREDLDVISEAGFDLANVSIRIPAEEGTYAVIQIRFPEEESTDGGRKLQHTARYVGLGALQAA